MQKVSYMGNGSTTEFTFNFPYFENTDVVVTKNGATATGYNIAGNSAGLDADIPYTGGKVVFETAPTALDNIVIARSLPLQRQYDYQPLEKINPTTLNQDINYLMEVLKDLQDELDSLSSQYADIVDKESTTTLLARISVIHDEIVAVSAQITELGDISTLRQSVTTNTGDIISLKDASNFTSTGKTAIKKMAFPSTRKTTLTLGASGSTYTAPDDGWFVLSISQPAEHHLQLHMWNNQTQMRVRTYQSDHDAALYIPARKNETVGVEYTYNGSGYNFIFVYADE